MLLIPCPWCGERAQTEFSYEGDATVSRPDPATASDEQWLDHIYLRDNPMGLHEELWHHVAGCRRFFKVRRNTVTHEISGSAAPTDDITEDVSGDAS